MINNEYVQRDEHILIKNRLEGNIMTSVYIIIHPCDPTVVICYLIWPCDIAVCITYLISHSS